MWKSKVKSEAAQEAKAVPTSDSVYANVDSIDDIHQAAIDYDQAYDNAFNAMNDAISWGFKGFVAISLLRAIRIQSRSGEMNAEHHGHLAAARSNSVYTIENTIEDVALVISTDFL